MEAIIPILLIGILYLLITVCETLSARKEAEQVEKKNSYRHTPKCSNCHCDELNRGR